MSKSEGELKVKEGELSLKRSDCLVMKLHTPKGRGVFASKDIPARTILEVCPVLVLDPVENEEHIKNTELYNFTYNWPYTPSPQKLNEDEAPPKTRRTTTQAIVFGLGSMFNHSSLHQNVGWERDLKNHLVTYITLCDIKAGEELCISYGLRLTFKDTDVEEQEKDSDDWLEVLNIIELID